MTADSLVREYVAALLANNVETAADATGKMVDYVVSRAAAGDAAASNNERESWIDANVSGNPVLVQAMKNIALDHDTSPVVSERQGLTDEQYVNAARSAGLLAELCIFSEYDPDVGRVPGHWKPRFMDFANTLLAARTGSDA